MSNLVKNLTKWHRVEHDCIDVLSTSLNAAFEAHLGLQIPAASRLLRYYALAA